MFEKNRLNLPQLAEQLRKDMKKTEGQKPKDFKDHMILEPGFIIHFGIKAGEEFCYFEDHKADEYIKACAVIREHETSKSFIERNAQSGQRLFVIPTGLRWEMEARGIPVLELLGTGDKKLMKPIMDIIESEYPAFKLTKHNLSTL